MDLRKVSFPAIPAKSNYSGSSSIEIGSGMRLKIETSPEGIDILDATVPQGKTWKVRIDVKVIEEDE